MEIPFPVLTLFDTDLENGEPRVQHVYPNFSSGRLNVLSGREALQALLEAEDQCAVEEDDLRTSFDYPSNEYEAAADHFLANLRSNRTILHDVLINRSDDGVSTPEGFESFNNRSGVMRRTWAHHHAGGSAGVLWFSGQAAAYALNDSQICLNTPDAGRVGVNLPQLAIHGGVYLFSYEHELRTTLGVLSPWWLDLSDDGRAFDVHCNWGGKRKRLKNSVHLPFSF